MKVLLLTGFGLKVMETSKASDSTSVVDGFVQKPIATPKLADKISGLIGET